MNLLDTVYMIADVKAPNLIYGRPGTNPTEAWNNVIQDKVMGTGITKKHLHARGFRAVRVQVVVGSSSLPVFRANK